MKKALSILISLILIFSVFTIIPAATAGAWGATEYYDADGTRHTIDDPKEISTTLSTGWYALTSDITISDRITCTGDVHLILCNNHTLTAPKGIAVNEGSSLTVYSNFTGWGSPGALMIDYNDNQVDAALGSNNDCNSGAITINGGKITVKSNSVLGAAIGGGSDGNGTVTINGGIINASIDNSEGLGAAIGGGTTGNGTVTINGGTVTATSSGYGAAIGGGIARSGTVTINGGKVTATCTGRGAGIGNGSDGGGSSISLSWSNETDSIKANSYSGAVTLRKTFHNGTTELYAGTVSDYSLISGKDLTASSVQPLDGVGYIDADGTAKTANGVKAITSRTNALSSGWYALTEDVTNESRITCTGDVKLILCDGATLTAQKGIAVNGGNSLTVYGQAAGTGALTIDYTDDLFSAALGGDNDCNSGAITINGGIISVTSSSMYGAAIGGGDDGNGTVTINGGTVTASTSSRTSGAAIGGGYGDGINGSRIVINGGTVTATSGGAGAGIGGAYVCNAEVTINGGNVTASTIGGGSYGRGNTTLSWSNETDSIKANSYNGTVTLKKSFGDGTDYYYAGVVADNSNLNNKTLTPDLRIPYIDTDGETKRVRNYTYFTSSMTDLNTGWYVVTADVTNENRITCTGDVNLILCDDAALTADNGFAVNIGNSLTVYGQEKGTGALMIDFKPDASSLVNNFQAAIGGDMYCSSGEITINGGVISVSSDSVNGAAIGGGYSNNSNDLDDSRIVINGGTVTAITDHAGAGIGGAYQCSADVTINGGTVTTTSIGSGRYLDSRPHKNVNVTINGGNVTASSIGGSGASDTITLSWTNRTDSIKADSYNGTVTLKKNFYYGLTEISSGTVSNNSTIAGKNLTVKRVETGSLSQVQYIDASGKMQTSQSVTIVGNNFIDYPAGWYAVKEDTEIDRRLTCNGDVNLILFDGATLTVPKGITVNEGSSLTIYGQEEGTGALTIDYQENGNASALGSEQENNSGAITINGGVITVNSTTRFGAAIGGGDRGTGTVMINRGTVNATSAGNGASIGGGYNRVGTVTINGGTINATSAGNGAGIGGGYYADGTVTINGGNITASSIGGGLKASGNITLSWTNRTDSITADSYVGAVTLAKAFTDGTTVFDTGVVSDNSSIAGKTLAPGYYITVAEGIAHGTITAPAFAAEGAQVTVTALADSGCELKNLSVKATGDTNFSVPLTALDGTAGYGTEVYSNMVDGKSSTKWCLSMSGTPYFIVKAESSVTMTGYSLTTANDTASNSGRNWTSWTIYGANFDDDSDAVQDSSAWQVVTSVTDDSTLEAKNYTKYDYALDAPAASYQYYMIKITENNGDSAIQMSEFEIRTMADSVTVVPGPDNTITFTMPASPVVISAIFTEPPTEPEDTYLIGDANSDVEVDITDATCIQRYLASYSVNNFDAEAAAVSGDELSILDATAIQRYLASYADPYHIGERAGRKT